MEPASPVAGLHWHVAQERAAPGNAFVFWNVTCVTIFDILKNGLNGLS